MVCEVVLKALIFRLFEVIVLILREIRNAYLFMPCASFRLKAVTKGVDEIFLLGWIDVSLSSCRFLRSVELSACSW